MTTQSRGIGYYTTKQLYELGATVYLGGRTESNALKAIEQIRSEIPESNGQLKWFLADMSSIKKAKHSAERFLKLESQLDILGMSFTFRLVNRLRDMAVQCLTLACEMHR